MTRRYLLTAGLFLAIHLLPAQADKPTLFTTWSMTPDTALKLASAVLRDCRSKNHQVSVAVVDRSGILQVLLRDQYASGMTPRVAEAKARTALNVAADTIDVIEGTKPETQAAGIRHISGFVILGGGVRVMASGSIVGAVGVSGAPGGKADDGCARAGIASISELLNF